MSEVALHTAPRTTVVPLVGASGICILILPNGHVGDSSEEARGANKSVRGRNLHHGSPDSTRWGRASCIAEGTVQGL